MNSTLIGESTYISVTYIFMRDKLSWATKIVRTTIYHFCSACEGSKALIEIGLLIIEYFTVEQYMNFLFRYFSIIRVAVLIG